jgi:hypothetical protein
VIGGDDDVGRVIQAEALQALLDRGQRGIGVADRRHRRGSIDARAQGMEAVALVVLRTIGLA